MWKTLEGFMDRYGAIGAMFAVCLALASWVIYAEICHAQQREDHQTIEQLVDFQNGVVREKELDAQAQKEKWRKVLELCLNGIIKDKATCAQAQAALK